jgi:hypothetical protein
MVAEALERKQLATQRRIRRLRQQRLLHSAAYLANGNIEMSTNGTQPKKQLLVRDLGWTEQEAADNHDRPKNFARFWEGPGVEEYDEM